MTRIVPIDEHRQVEELNQPINDHHSILQWNILMLLWRFKNKINAKIRDRPKQDTQLADNHITPSTSSDADKQRQYSLNGNSIVNSNIWSSSSTVSPTIKNNLVSFSTNTTDVDPTPWVLYTPSGQVSSATNYQNNSFTRQLAFGSTTNSASSSIDVVKSDFYNNSTLSLIAKIISAIVLLFVLVLILGNLYSTAVSNVD